ncbi:MAG: D-2-hydroxyacid dehydrogenase [Planctomycetia bacterium]|nr:D-2-hydroxyacid dehydrogenase [Planctomycetia bacterium]
MASPKIVVLDGATLNPGDNPWTDLEALGNVVVYDHSLAETVVSRSRGATVLVINKVKLSREFFQQVPDVRFVAVTATGADCVDVAAAREHGVPVSNVPIYGTDSVAQFAFALLLHLCHHVGLHDRAVHEGEWSRSADFCFWRTPLVELAGRTMGIVGFGRIGRRVGELAHAFGMHVLAFDLRRGQAPDYQPFAWAELQELFARSDVISLHCPSTPETHGIVNRDLLRRARPQTVLINTSRGDLVVEADLAAALDSGRLAAAAVDVVSQEPIRPDNPLLRAKNCVITPHIAWATLAARRRLMESTVANIANFLAGTPTNIVNA